jgi:putative (di)nucleoside polyphosphate hydrolase
VRSASLIAEAPGWFYYDLPPHLIGVAWGGRWRGQRQKWYAARFEGADTEIDIAAPGGHKAEFDAWRWARMDDLQSIIVPFKREVYREVVSAFRHLAV